MSILKLFLKTTLFLALTLGCFFHEDIRAWANKPNLGECHFNNLDNKSMLVIHEGPHYFVVVNYTEKGISGFYTIIDKDFVDTKLYKTTREECPEFALINETTAEVIQAFGLKEDFIKSICRSSIVNRENNYELCLSINE